MGFPLPYLLPATRDLLLAVSLLNWEKWFDSSKAQKKKLFSQLTDLQTQGYPMIVFVTLTFISELMLCLLYLFTSHLYICWGVSIPVFICLKLSIFHQKKVVQTTWTLIAFWLCWRNTDVSSCVMRGWDLKLWTGQNNRKYWLWTQMTFTLDCDFSVQPASA